MKKLLAVLAAAALLLVMAMPAMAATNPLASAKIYVAEQFDKLKGAEEAEVTSGAWTTETEDAYWQIYGYGVTTTLASGQILLTGEGGNAFRLNSFGTAAAITDLEGQTITGFGYYIENNTAVDVSMGTFMLSKAWGTEGDGANMITALTGFVLVDKDGNATDAVEGTPGTYSKTVVVPAGFKGYVVMPVLDGDGNSNFGDAWNGTGWDAVGKRVGSFGLAIEDLVTTGSENIVIDNFFYYGADIAENNDGVITFGSEEPNTDPGDLSMVAYALAAVTGLGSLTVLRRKK